MILIFYFFFLLNSVSSYFKQTDLKTSFFKKELDKNAKIYYCDNHYYLLSKETLVYDQNLEISEIVRQRDSRPIYFYFRFNQKSTLKILRNDVNHFFLIREGIGNFNTTIRIEGIPKQENLIMYQLAGTEYFNLLIYYVNKEKPYERYLYFIYVDSIDFQTTHYTWSEKPGQNEYFRDHPTKVLFNKYEFKILVFQYVFTFQPETLFLKSKMFPGSNDNETHFMPYMNFFSTRDPRGKSLFITEKIFEVPLICTENSDEEGWGHKMYSQVNDAVISNEKGVPSLFYIADNRIGQALCFIGKRKFLDVYEDYNRNSDTMMNCTRFPEFEFCQNIEISLYANIILKLESKTYKRILVKTLDYEDKLSYIIFLLDNLNRFVVYDYVYNKRENFFNLCFEGVYSLINRETNNIQDVVLDEDNDQIIVITAFYTQKIPLTLFCSENSKSSCVLGDSTCSIGNKLSKKCKTKKSQCTISTTNKKKTTTISDLFFCDAENKDMCLVMPNNQSLNIKFKNLVCKKPLCLCKSTTCLYNECKDITKKEVCFMKKSEMILSSFIDVYNLEPIAYLFYSIVISFLGLAFVLISFYCCFSNSHVSKAEAQKSEISRVDLSKFDLKEKSKKRYK